GIGIGGAGGIGIGGAGGIGIGGAGGAGGGGVVCTPEGPFDGAPVVAQPNQWTWVPVPEAKCRNGSAVGFGVRINPASTKLFIYLQGGGACFNGATCLQNASSYTSQNFDGWKGSGGVSGIFDTSNPANSVKDWSAVFIPYCTGDVHSGNATGKDVPGFLAPKNQSFVGYANVGHYLKRIIPTFPGVTEVLLTGESAGGFGAAFNYDRVAQAFCPTPVVLVDDSGPVMSDTYMPPCLQTRWRDLWALNSTLPADCADCSLPNGGGMVNYVTYIGNKYAGSNLGLISSDKDGTIALFFGFGQNNCSGIDGFGSALPGAEFAAGLDELRTMFMMPYPSWSSFFVDSTSHTYLGGASYYNTTVMGVNLADWVGNIVNQGPGSHVGP
ncbi:MAG: pectinacetylesterase family protein, partial [Polyangiaceae bacterium]|nr:pectinacetylesterase family protein [Polyangiaceae bacterium]